MSKQRKSAVFIDTDGTRHRISKYHLAMVRGAVEAAKCNDGSTTPIEDFLQRVLERYDAGTLTFDDIEWALGEPKLNMAYIPDLLRTYARHYRKDLKTAISEVDAERAEVQAQRKTAASQPQPSNVKEMSA